MPFNSEYPGRQEIKGDDICDKADKVVRECHELVKKIATLSVISFKAVNDEDLNVYSCYLFVNGFAQELELSALKKISTTAGSYALTFDPSAKCFVFRFPANVPKTTQKHLRNTRQSIAEFEKVASEIIIWTPTTIPRESLPNTCVVAIQRILVCLMSKFKCNNTINVMVTDAQFNDGGDIIEVDVTIDKLSQSINLLTLSQEAFAKNSKISPHTGGLIFKIVVVSGMKSKLRSRGGIEDEDGDEEYGSVKSTKVE